MPSSAILEAKYILSHWGEIGGYVDGEGRSPVMESKVVDIGTYRRNSSHTTSQRHEAIPLSKMDPRDIQESVQASMEADEEDEEE